MIKLKEVVGDKMRQKRAFVTVFLFILIAVVSSFYIYEVNYVSKDWSSIDLNKARNLMIVAHPDDETLWGGAHLLEDDYLVVCITCGNNKTRSKEFKKVMEKTEDQYIMLGYPDKVLGIRSNWKHEEESIYGDLKKIILMKNWDLIVTHNEKGEYGHIHHILSHNIVSNIYNELNITNPLFFFGKYYTKKAIAVMEVLPSEIDNDLYDIKVNELIEIYKSQDFIKEKFNQMFRYEDWELYENEIAKGYYEEEC